MVNNSSLVYAQVEEFLTDSLMLSTPMIAKDPAYQQVKGAIPSIIRMSSLGLGVEDLDELSASQIYILGLKSLHTIYLRLATATAPEFDVTAEHASFKKGDRFFHYSALAKSTLEELHQAEQGDIQVAQVKISSRNGSLRNYNLSQSQKLNLRIDNITDSTIELSWKAFNLSLGDFYKYTLMYSKSPIYDEYAVPPIRTGEDIQTLDFYDIKRTKFRIDNLKRGVDYYILLIFYNRDGNKSFQQTLVTTGGDSCDRLLV